MMRMISKMVMLRWIVLTRQPVCAPAPKVYNGVEEDDDIKDDDVIVEMDGEDNLSVHQRQRPKFPGLLDEGVSPIHWSSKNTTWRSG